MAERETEHNSRIGAGIISDNTASAATSATSTTAPAVDMAVATPAPHTTDNTTTTTTTTEEEKKTRKKRSRRTAAKVQYSPEEQEAVAARIAERYATGRYTMESCCRHAGISSTTWYRWLAARPELGDMHREARMAAAEAFRTSLAEKAQAALLKLVEGYESIEEREEDVVDREGNKLGTRLKRTIRQVPPLHAAVVYALNMALGKEGGSGEENDADTGGQGGLLVQVNFDKIPDNGQGGTPADDEEDDDDDEDTDD